MCVYVCVHACCKHVCDKHVILLWLWIDRSGAVFLKPQVMPKHKEDCVCVCVRTCICICGHACMYVCGRERERVCVRVCAHMCVCNVNVCVCVCVCIYTYINKMPKHKEDYIEFCPTAMAYCSFLCTQALLPVLLPCHTTNIAGMFFSPGKSGHRPPRPLSPYSPTGWNCWTRRSSTPTWTSRSSWCLAPSPWPAWRGKRSWRRRRKAAPTCWRCWLTRVSGPPSSAACTESSLGTSWCSKGFLAARTDTFVSKIRHYRNVHYYFCSFFFFWKCFF